MRRKSRSPAATRAASQRRPAMQAMAKASAARATRQDTSPTSGSRAPMPNGKRPWPRRWSGATPRARAARRNPEGRSGLTLLFHQHLHLRAERLARGVARIEHVAARIDHELDAIRRGIGRQLIELDL